MSWAASCDGRLDHQRIRGAAVEAQHGATKDERCCGVSGTAEGYHRATSQWPMPTGADRLTGRGPADSPAASGRPASRIRAWVRSTGYGTRSHSTLAVSRVQDHGAGTRVAVARLAHATRVEDACAARRARAWTRRRGAMTSMWPPSSRKTSGTWVWPTRRAGLEVAKLRRASGHREQVLPERIARAAVDEREVRPRPGVVRQRLQPVPRRRADARRRSTRPRAARRR